MKWTLKNIIWLFVCLIAYFTAIWLCAVNFQEIVDRVQGRQTIFAQRTNLNDPQAVFFCAAENVAFIAVLVLSVMNLLRKKVPLAGIFGLILIALFFVSLYIESLFIIQL